MSTERAPFRAATPPPADDAPLREQLTQLKQQQERLFASLASGQQQFKHLARQVWRVQEEERRRLARELHDGIGGNLTALKHQLDALELALHERPDLRERAGAAVAITAATLEDTRELSRTFGLSDRTLAYAKSDAIVMHPGPINRGVEVSPQVADGPRAVILQQVSWGIAIRMAVLERAILGDTAVPAAGAA